MKMAITGHRKLPANFDTALLQRELLALCERGYTEFYIGMALGFDSACFRALDEAKRIYPQVKRIACVPCPDQDRFFTERQRQEYRKMLSESDEVVVLGTRYGSPAMMRRNRYMVQQADAVYAFLEKKKGGSYTTVCYARDTDKPVLFYGFVLEDNKK